MEIKRVDTQASASSSATASTVAAVARDKPAGQEGSAEWFTGKVWIEPLFEAPDPARIRCANVTFEPCARTAWHTHPLGQTLIVMQSPDGRRATYDAGNKFVAPGTLMLHTFVGNFPLWIPDTTISRTLSGQQRENYLTAAREKEVLEAWKHRR